MSCLPRVAWPGVSFAIWGMEQGLAGLCVSFPGWHMAKTAGLLWWWLLLALYVLGKDHSGFSWREVAPQYINLLGLFLVALMANRLLAVANIS